MRSEFEYVRARPGALAWLVGCVLASYSSRAADVWTRYAHQAMRRLAAFGIVVTMVGYALENRACGQTPPPAFTDTECELPHVTPDIRPRLRCGVVSVPRDYTHPEAGQYKLAVVVIRPDLRPARNRGAGRCTCLAMRSPANIPSLGNTSRNFGERNYKWH